MSRFAILVDNYMKTNEILTVENTNYVENIWFFTSDIYDRCNYAIGVGVSIDSHIKSANELQKLKEVYSDANYMLTYESKRKIPVNISLKRNYNSDTLLESVFQSLVIQFTHRSDGFNDKQLLEISNERSDNNRLLKLTRNYTRKSFNNFKQRCSAVGWDLTRVLIFPCEWTYSFT